ncbi:4498_t:CDS:2, partial [Paraglomus occultum]
MCSVRKNQENQQIRDAIDNSITVLDTIEPNYQFSAESGISNMNTTVTSSAALETETIWVERLLTGSVDVIDLLTRWEESSDKQLAALRNVLCAENPPGAY